MVRIKTAVGRSILALAVTAGTLLTPVLTSTAQAASADGTDCWVGRVWKQYDARRPYLSGWYAAFHIQNNGPSSRSVTGVWRIRTSSDVSHFTLSQDLRRRGSASEVAKLSSKPRAPRPSVELVSCG
jgi:hypothetical protein